jgi:hypothetical protein
VKERERDKEIKRERDKERERGREREGERGREREGEIEITNTGPYHPPNHTITNTHTILELHPQRRALLSGQAVGALQRHAVGVCGQQRLQSALQPAQIRAQSHALVAGGLAGKKEGRACVRVWVGEREREGERK